jgi:4-amino-4-deoxy-L-arabinose transferase-like glycosyltransferase
MQPQHPARSADSQAQSRGLFRKAGLIALLSVTWFGLGLNDLAFVDENAYITQSYQPDMFFAGRANDRAWLEFVAFDLVPLPKYLINLSFRAAGIARPGRSVALAWYRDTRLTWGSSRALTIARLPSVLMGALGCASIFLFGVLVKDEPTGWIAAAFLAINPLYRLHAHRAMSEAPCEAFTLLSLALGLWAWKAILSRPRAALGLVALIGAGFLAGLSMLAKFNGIIALMALSGWCLLGLALSGIAGERKLVLLLGTVMACASAWLVFVELNPSMTAYPPGRLPVRLRYLAEMDPSERFLFFVDYRRDMARSQQRMFAHNALEAPLDRAAVVLVQGFGRFGPFGPGKSDSTRRYDPSQDFGVLVWLPLVLAGLAASIALGARQRREGSMPTAWALVLWAGVAVGVVTAYLPMAWDRYQLPIQAPAALLAAVALATAWGWFRPASTVSAVKP